MKILTLDETGVRFGGKVFRTRVIGSLMGVVIVIAMLAGLIFGYVKGEVPVGVLIVLGLFLGFLLLLSLGMIRRGFSGENWLMVLSPDEVLIKYRSYLNCHMSRSDRQVFVLNIDEIVWVRKVKRKEITFVQRGRTSTTYLKFLDIMLSDGLGEAIKGALAAERQVERDYKNSSGKITTKFRDYPISVMDDSVLRVKMISIRPGVKAALEWFVANGIEEKPVCKEVEDFTDTLEDKKQMDDKILTLAMGGKKIAAVKLARRAYGMGLREAKEFVDGLME